jgi:aconitate decarboxylase
MSLDAAPSLTQQLARVLAGPWAAALPGSRRQEMRATVRTAFIDTAACILAGRSEASTRVVAAWARAQRGPGGTSTLLFGDGTEDASRAALINGVASHALDYDDVGMAGHPSAVLVPAILAEHERAPCTAAALVEAYATGYAVWGELQRRMRVHLHARGWHPSSVFGTIAAAAAIASMRRLDEKRFADALGASASFAGGVIANFGSMTKPLHIGRAAQAGIDAVALVQAGLDASPDALDGRAGLLVATAGDASHVDLESPVPDDVWTMLLRQRPGIKKYPVCYALHRLVDGAIDLGREHGIAAGDVDSIEVTLSDTAASVVRHHSPSNVTEARFSAEFAVAAALVHGRLGIHEVSEASLANAAVRELMQRVSIRTVQTRCPLEPSFALTDEVAVKLRNGKVLGSGPIRFARGHAQLPAGDDLLREKLVSCAGSEDLAARVMRRIDEALA